MKKSYVILVALLVISSLMLAGCGQSNQTSNRTSKAETAQTKQDTAPKGFTKVEVVRVVDGDTLEVMMNGKQEKVRLIGVNTPEVKHPTKPVEYYGKEASAFTKKQLPAGKTLYLEFDVTPHDKYNRYLAYAWLEIPGEINDKEIRAKMFNAKLLLDGYAGTMTIPPNVKYSDQLKKYEAEARKAEKGLWSPH